MTGLEQLSDEELLVRLQSDEVEALRVLFLRHSGRVKAYGLKKGLSEESAEDLVQAVFLKLYSKRHLYLPKYAALQWIFVISASEIRDRWKKTRNEISLHLSHSQVEEPKGEVGIELAQRMKPLGLREKEVVESRYIYGEDFSEIAHRLGQSEVNIRQILSRALRKMRGK
ncbi:MAG: sigma-70 family RNA polymerase sigma factor [Bdellovibrionaceae bacterium]|nr:sigma-70 family RNA polymerase sigma factor [Pseudobdellovibrionaceae bacterium]